MAEVVMVTLATVMASGLLKDVTMRAIDALCDSSNIGGNLSALFGGLNSDVESLHRELKKLQALLQAERLYPASTTTNDLVFDWLRDVEEAVYYADNVLDKITLRKIRLQVGRGLESLNAPVFRRSIANKVKKFLSMTQKIDADAAKIGIKPVKLLGVSDRTFPAALGGSSEDVRAYVVAIDPVGRVQDEKFIVEQLCQVQDGRELSVVAIVGMSGIGKTSLARRAYHSDKVAGHFARKFWISVFDDLHVKRILNEMTESVTKSGNNLSNIGVIEDTLHSVLKERRFLLVLDNVRNVDAKKWNFLKNLLERVGGSVLPLVLVTTQNDEVASAMNAAVIHVLQRLSESHSLILFEREAFATKSPKKTSELKPVGERIVKKCNGVPLAIKALASVLKSKDEKMEWEAIENNQVWGLDSGVVMMPSLLLSFNDLPSESAKRCFVYCSVILPKDFSATENTLVQLWMAHGFLQQSKLRTFEEHGQEIVQVLLRRYLLQVDKYDSFEEVISYRMHDLMYNLALHISKGTCLVLKHLDELSDTGTDISAVKRLKHVRVTEKNKHSLTDQTSRSKFSKLRLWSLFSLSRVPENGNCMKYLRVLSLTCGLAEVPASIGRLNHLRYLDLSKNLFRVLPNSIGDLGHLQTLKLKHCGSLTKLPDHITKLINLRHLSTTKHVVLPVGFGKLTDLQELPKLNLQAVGWKVDELKCFLNVGSVLSIKGVEHIKSKEDARQSNLLSMSKISQLELIWNKDRSDENDLAVMDGLQPHSNLKDLLLKNYSCKRFPPWLSNMHEFPTLKVLSLLNCEGCERLPTLGHLPSLQILTISGLMSLQDIEHSFYHNKDVSDKRAIPFPNLKELTFQKMHNLRHWEGPPKRSTMLAFPCLVALEIKECPNLITAPSHFPSLQKLSLDRISSGEPLEMILSNSNQLTSLSVQNVQLLSSLSKELLHCTSLQQIKISNCKNLTHFPKTLRTLHSLEVFHVEVCESVISLPDITGLVSLTRLVIQKCTNLTSSPNGLDTCKSLETLALSGCPNLDVIPNLAKLKCLKKLVFRSFSNQREIPNWFSTMSRLRSLDIGDLNKELDEFPDIGLLPASLSSLYIVGWPKIQSLPRQLCKFTQLECLALISFDGVKSLPRWLCNLSSLQILVISECENIKSLAPKDDMQRLDRLRVLNIKSCPLLKERCVKDQGPEWDKIAHIHRISIDNEDIQKLT